MWEDPSQTDWESAASRRRQRAGGRLLWLMFLSTAWLLFEANAPLSLVAIVACVKFGCNDVLTAAWLWRSDPIPCRGTACAFFYLASGCWKVTGTAAVLTFILSMVALAPNQPAAILEGLGTTMLVAAVGLMLSNALSMLAACLAWLQGIRVWVNGTVHHSRRENVTPPQAWGKNQVRILTTVPLILLLLVAPPFVIEAGSPTVLAIGLVVGIVVLLTLYGRLMQRLDAATPQECWGDWPDRPLREEWDEGAAY